MYTQKLDAVEYLDKDEVSCSDEDVVACLDEGLVKCRDMNNKDYFDVDFLLPHSLE